MHNHHLCRTLPNTKSEYMVETGYYTNKRYMTFEYPVYHTKVYITVDVRTDC